MCATLRGLPAALLALALILGTAHAARRQEARSTQTPNWTPPDFCRNKDCPEFAVLQTKDDIELRQYKAANWATTNVSNTKWDDAYNEGYKRLQNYVKGDNEHRKKLAQTNPSFTLLYPADVKARTLQGTFTIEYFVPFELQDAPPEPRADDVDIVHVPQQEVWVKSFSGFAKEEDVIKTGFDFVEALQAQGVDVDASFLGLALYDLPARLIDRHNEIWVWPKAQPSSAFKRTSNCKDSKKAKAENQGGRAGGAFASASASSDGVRSAYEAAWSNLNEAGEVVSGRVRSTGKEAQDAAAEAMRQTRENARRFEAAMRDVFAAAGNQQQQQRP